jgi:hypothetical protein
VTFPMSSFARMHAFQVPRPPPHAILRGLWRLVRPFKSEL